MTETGTREDWTDWDGDGSRSITVPSDCELIAMLWFGLYPWSTNNIPANPCDVDDDDFVTVEKTDEQTGDGQIWMGYLVNPSTGSQTFTYDFTTSNPLDSGARHLIAYFKGVNTSSPIVDSAQELADDTDVTGMSGATTGDLMIGGVSSFNSNLTSVTDNGQTQLLLQSQFNKISAGAAMKDAATGFYYSGGANQTAVAMIIAQAAAEEPPSLEAILRRRTNTLTRM